MFTKIIYKANLFCYPSSEKIKIMVVAINTIALHSCYIKLHCQLTSSLHNKRTSMPQIVCGVPMMIRIIRTIVPSTIALHPYKREKQVLRSSQYGCLKGHICDKNMTISSRPQNTVAIKVTLCDYKACDNIGRY